MLVIGEEEEDGNKTDLLVIQSFHTVYNFAFDRNSGFVCEHL
jgi:hypothetical protein